MHANANDVPFAPTSELREELHQFLSQAQRRLDGIRAQLDEEGAILQSTETAATRTALHETRLEDSLLGALPQAADSSHASEITIDGAIEARPSKEVLARKTEEAVEAPIESEEPSDRLQAIKLRLQKQLQNN